MNAVTALRPAAADLLERALADQDTWADLTADNAADCALDALQLAYDNWCDDVGFACFVSVQAALPNYRALLNELTIEAWAEWDRRESIDVRTDDTKYLDRLAQYNDATRDFWREV